MIAWWWLIVAGWAGGTVGVLLGVRLGDTIATMRENTRPEERDD